MNYTPSRTWAAAGYSVAGAPEVPEVAFYGMDGWPFEFPAPQIGADNGQPKPRIEWQLVRAGNAWQGTITIPTTMDSDKPGQGKVTVKAKGKAKTKEGAVKAASTAALRALNNPLVRSVLPPGASQVVAVLSNAKVQKAIAKYGAKGARVAKRAIMRVFK